MDHSGKHGVSFVRASPGQRWPDTVASDIDMRGVAGESSFFVLIDYGSPYQSTTPHALAMFTEDQAWELRETITQALEKP